MLRAPRKLLSPDFTWGLSAAPKFPPGSPSSFSPRLPRRGLSLLPALLSLGGLARTLAGKPEARPACPPPPDPLAEAERRPCGPLSWPLAAAGPHPPAGIHALLRLGPSSPCQGPPGIVMSPSMRRPPRSSKLGSEDGVGVTRESPLSSNGTGVHGACRNWAAEQVPSPERLHTRAFPGGETQIAAVGVS